jgi:hypothetical protein
MLLERKSTVVGFGVNKGGWICNKGCRSQTEGLAGYGIDAGQRSYAVFKDQGGCVDDAIQNKVQANKEHCQPLQNINVRRGLGRWSTKGQRAG